MSLSNDERRVIVGLEYEKARNTYAQIAELRKLCFWDNIANRLYYSVFHAVAALLIHDGHSVNTHKGALALFGNYYIRTGILPSQAGRLYSDLQTMRNNSDYNCSYNASQQEIEPLIVPAGELINKIGVLINDNESKK